MMADSHLGLAIAWPKVTKEADGVRNQFHHVMDVVPTTEWEPFRQVKMRTGGRR